MEQLADGVYIRAEDFRQRRSIFTRQHSASGAIYLVDSEIRINRDHSCRNAFQDDLHISATSLQFTCCALELLRHVVKQRYQQSELIIGLDVNAMVEISCGNLTRSLGKCLNGDGNSL